ncbi:MAG TPA: ABC transporter permease [Gaiellaceae bacterium]|jgi:ABC-type dipeptide/oligopeptide/nickel transport system permease component
MANYAARRVAAFVPVLVGVSLLVFGILRLIPGDPARILLFGTQPTQEQLEQLRQQLGLTRSLPHQYAVYLENLFRGDLGTSFTTAQPVSHDILQRLPSTLALAGAAMLVAIGIGIPLGIVAGMRPGGIVDRLATGVSVLGLAVPYFWLAFLLILLFAVRLRWLPSLGTGSPQAIILPALSLGIGFASVITRLMRSSLIDTYQQPYVKLARAKGLSERAVLFRHAMPNALVSVVTILGIEFGAMVSGAVVIEVVFGRPGLGSYLVTAIQDKDIPAVQGTVLVISVLYLVINLCVDLTYGLLDPRVRASWRSG